MKNQATQPKKKLTKKQQDFVDDYVINGNGTRAAQKAYDVNKYETAAVIATENLNKPNVAEAVEAGRLSLKEALAKQGVTPEKIAEKVDHLLNSDNDKFVDKGIAHATKIYGVAEEGGQGNQNTYNFIFSKEIQDEVNEIEARIKSKLIGHVKED